MNAASARVDQLAKVLRNIPSRYRDDFICLLLGKRTRRVFRAAFDLNTAWQDTFHEAVRIIDGGQIKSLIAFVRSDV